MTNQTQSALLSDGEVAQCINRASTNLFDRAGTTSFRIARAIEQAVLAKLQPAQSIPPGLRVGDSHMESLIEAAIQGHAGTRDAMRWLVRQIARVEDKPAQAGELPDELEAFEAWARPNGYDLRRNDVLGHYSSLDTSRAWSGYRAALAARKPLTDEQRRALADARNVAMRNAAAARIPECGDFAAIAQNLDWLCDQFGINGLEVKT